MTCNGLMACASANIEILLHKENIPKWDALYWGRDSNAIWHASRQNLHTCNAVQIRFFLSRVAEKDR